jgi:hypothetical protein
MKPVRVIIWGRLGLKEEGRKGRALHLSLFSFIYIFHGQNLKRERDPGNAKPNLNILNPHIFIPDMILCFI